MRNVYVSTDDSDGWQRAELEPPRARAWQRFSMRWTPARRGGVALASLAEAIGGLLQPISGRRNAIHRVPVDIT